ncbi:MAG: helix-turn-helix domain-containing protein [Bacteroidetes bacterium]|nr:helix-turn-helix domain-containing protein [Bacteroidota bacterium]
MSDVVFLPIDLVTAKVIHSPSARLLYWVLSARCIGGRAFNVTREYLSSITGFHVDKVSKLVGELRKLGLVRTYLKGPRGMAYYLPRSHRVRCAPGKFSVVPRYVILNKRLRAQARVVYVAIRVLAFGALGAPVAVSRLEAATGFSGRTISRYIPGLVGSGLLEIHREREELTHYYPTDGYREPPIRKKQYVVRRAKNSPSLPPELLWEDAVRRVRAVEPPAVSGRAPFVLNKTLT